VRMSRHAAVGIVALALLVVGCGSGTHKGAPAGQLNRPVPHEVGASGLVIARSPASARLCDGTMPAELTAGPPRCSTSIRLSGVRLSELSARHVVDGVTVGTAYVAGVLRDDVLHVTYQGQPREGRELRLADPPCAAPAAGWARLARNAFTLAAVSAYQRQFPGDLISVAIFHPGSGGWVVTVASVHPERSSARLGPAYPGHLCVVRSHYTRGEVGAAMAIARRLLAARGADRSPYQVTGFGQTTGTDGQVIVTISALTETSALLGAVGSQPKGLVRITPWLRPISPSGSAVLG
jgi:hypothetical protein